MTQTLSSSFSALRPARLLVLLGAFLACLALLATTPAAAQSGGAGGIETVDPDLMIDGDLEGPAPSAPSSELPASSAPTGTPTPLPTLEPEYVAPESSPSVAGAGADASHSASQAVEDPQAANTYKKDDLIGAAEGVFGKGAEGLARMIEDILAKQGEPNGYIVGREGGGAFIFGARYGSGTLFHKVEGQQPVYWRGPSLGIDVGANAANTFVLVYNLYDTEDLFETYGSGEGQAYLIGGFHVSYLRRGDVVLIPVRMGAGLRLGLNVGYMKFSKKQKWLPF